MNKKAYLKPEMQVVQLQHRSQLLIASPAGLATSVDGNVFEGGIFSDEDYDGEVR